MRLMKFINWFNKLLTNTNDTSNDKSNDNITTFLDLLTNLSSNKVKYILVGGLAVDFCGYSRATHDVDIIIEYSESNINLLLSCLTHFGQGYSKELSYKDFDLNEGCLRIVEDYPLDIFTIMRGKVYQDLIKYVKIDQTTKTDIPYLNAEGLIELKKNSLRLKDQLDIQALQTLIESNGTKKY